MKLRILAFLLFLLASFGAAPASAQDWAKAQLNKSPRHSEWIELKHDGRTVKAFVVYPEAKTKTAAVVVVHEIFGLTDWARALADEIAAA
ncbi:MAG: dienelactone hydrolase family protein, partial [Chthoniobacterales bacterium]